MSSDEDSTTLIGGRFRVLGTLGKGATAIVLRAEDTTLDRMVAIKLPRHDILKEKPYLKKMFYKEAKYLATLEHPSVLPLHDYFESSQGPVLVTRYVEATLAHAQRQESAGTSFAIGVATQLASALDFCVARGIAHRDVKPDNVLVDETGYSYLTDFGLAAKLDDKSKWTDVVGTPLFVSPEVLFEQKLATREDQRGKADQFSFGVLLYHMLTSRFPFDAPPRQKCPPGWEFCTALRLWRHETPVSCSQRNSDVPVAVDDVITQMLSIDPESRFPSNQKAAHALSEALEGRGASRIRTFVSFSHSDMGYVRPFIDRLRSRDISVWWDSDIVHGSDWDDQIEEGMLSSDVMLVIVTHQSVVSTESKREWKYWLDYIQKPVIPIVLKECRLPYRLSALQRIEAGTKSAEDLAAEVASILMKGKRPRDSRMPPPSGIESISSVPMQDLESIVLRSVQPGEVDAVANLETVAPDAYRLSPRLLQQYILRSDLGSSKLGGLDPDGKDSEKPQQEGAGDSQ